MVAELARDARQARRRARAARAVRLRRQRRQLRRARRRPPGPRPRLRVRARPGAAARSARASPRSATSTRSRGDARHDAIVAPRHDADRARDLAGEERSTAPVEVEMHRPRDGRGLRRAACEPASALAIASTRTANRPARRGRRTSTRTAAAADGRQRRRRCSSGTTSRPAPAIQGRGRGRHQHLRDPGRLGRADRRLRQRDPARGRRDDLARACTEYLDLELDDERWRCRVCDHDLGSARENYKHACQVNQRDPREIHQPLIEAEYTFAPDPDWVRIVEFHCPGCFTQIETEYLPPGHPITHDIEIDLDRLRERLRRRRAGDPRRATRGRARAMNTIDVDVGGTFTDLRAHARRRDAATARCRRRRTTCSVGFMQVVEEAAEEAGLSLEDLVAQVETVRYSTTVAMNRLLERSGPRVALITTQGHEDATLIGKGAQWIDGTRLDERRALPLQNKPRPIVPRELIVGVKERIDARGEVIRPLDEDARARAGPRGSSTAARARSWSSLLWSFVNPAHEKAVKRIIREEYRDYHVGYLPVILSSRGRLAARRVRALEHRDPRRLPAALDADRALRHLGQAARARLPRAVLHDPQHRRLRRPVQDDRVSRTYNGGPIAGLIGARDIAQLLGAHNVVTADVGGTSFDIGLVVGRLRPQLRVQPDHRPVDGLDDHAAVAVDRRRRRVDRVAQRGARRPARGRAAQRRLLPGPGRLPARRHRADGHRRRTSCSATSARTRSSPGAWRSTARPPRRRSGRGSPSRSASRRSRRRR